MRGDYLHFLPRLPKSSSLLKKSLQHPMKFIPKSFNKMPNMSIGGHFLSIQSDTLFYLYFYCVVFVFVFVFAKRQIAFRGTYGQKPKEADILNCLPCVHTYNKLSEP